MARRSTVARLGLLWCAAVLILSPSCERGSSPRHARTLDVMPPPGWEWAVEPIALEPAAGTTWTALGQGRHAWLSIAVLPGGDLVAEADALDCIRSGGRLRIAIVGVRSGSTRLLKDRAADSANDVDRGFLIHRVYAAPSGEGAERFDALGVAMKITDDGDDAPERLPAPQLTDGWVWDVPPFDLTGIRAGEESVLCTGAGSAMILTRTPSGNVAASMILLSTESAPVAEETRFEIRAFDRNGSPVTHHNGMSVGSRQFRVCQASFDEIGAAAGEGVRQLGVARLDAAARRAGHERAMERARAAGANVLPLPVVGRPFEFDFPTVEGGRIRSQDLRGQVVLIDCWATWCGICMRSMPEVRRALDRYGKDGLTVVGINFDRRDDLDKARAAIRKERMAWPNVFAPPLGAHGEENFWETASGIEGIPRFFLIDRDGILRGDFYVNDFEAELAKCFGKPPTP